MSKKNKGNLKTLRETFEVIEKSMFEQPEYYNHSYNNLYMIDKTKNGTEANLLLKNFYYSNKFSLYISFEEMLQKLIPYLFKKTSNQIEIFKKDLGEIREFKVYKWITGLHTEDKVEMGDYTVYNFEKHKENFKDEIKRPDIKLFKQIESSYLLEIRVKAMGGIFALERANNKEKNFINAMHYFFGENYRIIIGILKGNWENELAISEIEGEKKYAHRSSGETKLIANLDEFLESLEKKSIKDNIFKLLSEEGNNKLEEVIKTSFNWLGESVGERDESTSLLKGMIALEAIFSRKATGIAPSILSLVCDSTAIILSDDFNERKEIAKRLKEIYNLRSEIVHEGAKGLPLKTMKSYLTSIVKIVHSNLLLDEKWKNYSNKEEFLNVISDEKFK